MLHNIRQKHGFIFFMYGGKMLQFKKLNALPAILLSRHTLNPRLHQFTLNLALAKRVPVEIEGIDNSSNYEMFIQNYKARDFHWQHFSKIYIIMKFSP